MPSVQTLAMRLSIGRVRPDSRSSRLLLTKSIVSACEGICSARICSSGVSSEATGLPNSRARTASTRSIACAGSSPSRRAAMTLSEAIWNSGANLAKVSGSTHCAFSWRSIRRTSAGGSGSFF